MVIRRPFGGRPVSTGSALLWNGNRARPIIPQRKRVHQWCLSMDVQSAICALVNLGLSLMAATLVFPGPPAEPATAAAPTSPWDPLFSLIGALWNHWKGSKSQQKDTPNAVKASIASAEQGL